MSSLMGPLRTIPRILRDFSELAERIPRITCGLLSGNPKVVLQRILAPVLVTPKTY
jgi:hypothetical protein